MTTDLITEHSAGQSGLFGFAPAGSGTAVFSADRRHRYVLTRRWDGAGPDQQTLVWVGLNPSKAGADEDDPTVTRIMSFSERHGYGGCAVVNLFSLVSTDPAGLVSAESPFDEHTDRLLAVTAGGCDVVCCWGSSVPRALAERPTDVLAVLRAVARQTYALAVNSNGSPKHPLYVRGDTPLTPYPV